MIRPEPWSHRLARLSGDLAVAAVAFLGAFNLRIFLRFPFTTAPLPADRFSAYGADIGLVFVGQILALYLVGLYDRPHPRTWGDVSRRTGLAVVLLGVGLGTYFFAVNRTFPRSVLVLLLLLDLVLLVAWRRFAHFDDRAARRRVAIVGSGVGAIELAAKLRAVPGGGVDVAGWVPAPGEGEEASEGRRDALGPRLGNLEDLPALAADGTVDDVVLATDAEPWRTRLLGDLAANPGRSRGSVLLLPGPFDSLIGRLRYRWVLDLPLIEVVRDSEWRPLQPVKRALDVAFGASMATVLAPVLALVALAVKFSSPGPVLYRQERVGRNLKPFILWKFRTMRSDAEQDGAEVLAVAGDSRLTSIGAALRRYRLDELPQLWNVLEGTMSLVGPRPERPGFVRQYLAEVPGYAERFAVVPGLTGLAQVNGEYHSTAQNKLRYDLAYIANWTVWLDLWLLLRTVKIVLTSRGV
ncbi:MAG: sugar transferase [Thermoanaerobaculia bacterium]|nr:sugar transferase [Thermoanaerobaculia bacterium]